MPASAPSSLMGAGRWCVPGVADDGGYFRLNYAHPLGAGAGEARWSITFSRALDLLRPF